MPELIMVFEWDGKTVHKETKGFTGSSCVKATKFIDEALGEAGTIRKKTEFYEQESESEQERLRN